MIMICVGEYKQWALDIFYPFILVWMYAPNSSKDIYDISLLILDLTV